ncbi:MAG: energy transducer TonB, partial [Rhodospirillaceae bacterium]
AKLTHEKQRQTRQKRQSLAGKQRLKQLEDMRPESAPSKSRIVSAQPAAVIKTRPSGFASNLPPIYPNLARRRGIQGTVVIIAGISPSGLVSSTKIKTSSGSGTLDNAAIRAIRDWRFTPATNNGRPITSEVEIPLTFKIK